MKSIFKRHISKRKGSVTVESIIILTLFLFMTLFVWQFVVAGIAILETQDWLSRASRDLAMGEPKADVEQLARDRFKSAAYYTLNDIHLELEDEKATAKAEIGIHPVVKGLPIFPYQTEVIAPVMNE
ncbi:TadE/TadG family type IV pilus assembly protein [Desmospora activa]|uniref:TadE-like protein n=1 Tax=Desmospora activa DSM 45169 TaxID=1121389 RepID=A0A2T4Z1V7_9BACL|nr:hypothetical protein [Desmospora activa]PTM54770.1 hypothetical protein C8J48_3422 [Desmospora activa DSM 45169]